MNGIGQAKLGGIHRLLDTIADHTCFRAHQQADLVQLALGANLVKGIDQRAGNTGADGDQSVAVTAKDQEDDADRKEDDVKKAEQISA